MSCRTLNAALLHHACTVLLGSFSRHMGPHIRCPLHTLSLTYVRFHTCGVSHTLGFTHVGSHTCWFLYTLGLTYARLHTWGGLTHAGLHPCGVSHMLSLTHPGPRSCKTSHLWGSYTCWASHMWGLIDAEQTDNTQSELQQPHLLKQSQVISFLFSFCSNWQVISLQTNLVPCTRQANAQAPFILKRWLTSVASSFLSLSLIFFVLFCFEDCL